MAEHYFSAEPSAAFKRATVRARGWGHELELVSGSGVFSHGRLDTGTAVLLREAKPSPAARRVLDLGCGYGVVAVALGLALPTAQVWAVDVNERALELTRENAEASGVAGRLHVTRPGDVPPDVTFDEIWSNPPIRIGKAALHGLLRGWLGRLTPEGRALLVVGKNLGADSLHRWLDEQGYPTERLASAIGFRVLQTRGASGAANPVEDGA